MTFFRRLVSQKKKRFTDDGFDLDLAYITENIIAMGFPSGDTSDIAGNSASIMGGRFSTVEALYRNPVEEVIRFLEQKHPDHYKIYNLCIERVYDPELFGCKVASFPFEDHNCPPVEILHPFAMSAKQWLLQNMDNVVVVHCKAGKSRTGLMICVLLLFLGFSKTAKEAIDFYNRRRTHDLKGLTLASQQRYVGYYYHILHDLNGSPPKPLKRYLHRMRLINVPPQMRLFFEVWDHKGMIYSYRGLPCFRDLNENALNMYMDHPVVLTGDLKIWFYTYGSFKDRHLFYFWINTNFANDAHEGFGGDDGGIVRLTPKLLDKFSRRTEFPPNFALEMYFPLEIPAITDGPSPAQLAYYQQHLAATAAAGGTAAPGLVVPAPRPGSQQLSPDPNADPFGIATFPPSTTPLTPSDSVIRDPSASPLPSVPFGPGSKFEDMVLVSPGPMAATGMVVEKEHDFGDDDDYDDDYPDHMDDHDDHHSMSTPILPVTETVTATIPATSSTELSAGKQGQDQEVESRLQGLVLSGDSNGDVKGDVKGEDHSPSTQADDSDRSALTDPLAVGQES
eukprot:TRINITY_DN3157_c0_g1::TRINITY_DN3157_c0_g1_i1::g.3663::m.3663 TRINITY_DN3157_c0_g1::TRINITY_DN3157_c0_g1_i1::g.3663  ORF type:complete len:564 (-),score=66.38,sp/Q9LT75/PTN2A_ARATH/38.57/6e-82,PTEN_C2/PF10409.4/2e-10,Y_phosphatase3/PF13350.1/2e-06,DSPc/PF00782.15/2e-05,Y_phosphatase/PF00102.22/0.00081,Y_phosphatase2/PF03162.8/0.023,PTPlike_phytase/PF14566.1/0.063,DUF3316/PF11777.3/0.17 TRINITY_DN3157_c0_g1_i1:291-1982(-)